jgi:DNA processing protein
MGVGMDRPETVALFTLLRAAPRGVRWYDVAEQVRFAGSALAVLERVRETSTALFPDPAVDRAGVEAEAELAAWDADGLDLVTVLSRQYPEQLASVFDCPPFLFTRGALMPRDRGMSVVGSRVASPDGLGFAKTAARLLAERGLTVVSGLADGIDTAAHTEALESGARTVAVIGTGIRRAYPASNRDLQDEIAAKGLVVSQFYPDQPPTRTTFPMRNGTMSGYGLATIVAEAGEHSGSRVQARKALDHGRRVIVSAQVADSTSWGAAMAKEGSAQVAGSASELAAIVDQVVEDSSDEFLSALGLSFA